MLVRRYYKIYILLVFAVAFLSCSEEKPESIKEKPEVNDTSNIISSCNILERNDSVIVNVKLINNSSNNFYFPATKFHISGYTKDRKPLTSIIENSDKINLVSYHQKGISHHSITTRWVNYFYGKYLPIFYKINKNDSLEIKLEISNIKHHPLNDRKILLDRNGIYTFNINIVYYDKKDISSITTNIKNINSAVIDKKIVKYKGNMGKEGINDIHSEYSNIKLNDKQIKELNKTTNKNLVLNCEYHKE